METLAENNRKHHVNFIARLKNDIKTQFKVMRCLKNSGQIPLVSKVLLGLAVAYLLSPIDLIPDFIPIIGELDDVLIVVPLIWLAYLFIPKEIMKKCKTQINKETKR